MEKNGEPIAKLQDWLGIMSIGAMNVPLAALFGLCYGLGHPSLAAYRPAVADATLASFHNDVNRTVKDVNDGLAELLKMKKSLGEASRQVARVEQPAMSAVKSPIAEPTLAHARSAIGVPPNRQAGLAEPQRKSSPGFTELKAR